MEQITELKDSFERERKERQSKEEEIISLLREISARIQDNLL